jgi:hypothetical protein
MASIQVFPLTDAGSNNVETTVWTLDPTPTIDFTGGSARLVLRLQNWFATLSRSSPRRYNSAEQAVEFPDDRGLDFVPVMAERTLTFIPRSRMGG